MADKQMVEVYINEDGEIVATKKVVELGDLFEDPPKSRNNDRTSSSHNQKKYLHFGYPKTACAWLQSGLNKVLLASLILMTIITVVLAILLALEEQKHTDCQSQSKCDTTLNNDPSFDCLVKCQSQPNCTSFTYSILLKKCILENGTKI